MKSFRRNSGPGRDAVVWLKFLTGVQNWHYCFGRLSVVAMAEKNRSIENKLRSCYRCFLLLPLQCILQSPVSLWPPRNVLEERSQKREQLNCLIFCVREPKSCDFFSQWLILGSLCKEHSSWVSVLWHSKLGHNWQIILRCLFGVLIKQELQTGTQVKESSRSFVSSIHILQMPLLLRCVWVFCSGWISFSWSYFTEGCVCMHLPMVLLQNKTLKILCSGQVMAARKSAFWDICRRLYPQCWPDHYDGLIIHAIYFF